VNGFEWIAEVLPPIYAGAELVVGRLAGVSFGALAVALALHSLKLTARARAWHNIVRAAYPCEQMRFAATLGAYASGVGASAVLPGRPGELLKLALTKRRLPGGTYPALASTLATETLFDMAVGVLLTAGFVLFGSAAVGSVASLPHPSALVAAAAVAVAGAAVAAWRIYGARLRPLAAELGRGFRALHDVRAYLRYVVLWQLAALGLRVASVCFFLGAFHLPVSPRTAFLVMAAQCASGLIPLTPGGAGTQQTLLVVALGASVAAEQVVGFGIGMQLATTALNVGFGVLSLLLLTGSLRWRCLVAAAQT
jgi:uncharacterized membrane protein YbhN (UPF0104 family)